MKRSELAHVLRAASRIVDAEMLVIGSQAIHGGYDESELPEVTMVSREVDIAFFDDPDESKANRLDGALGELSQFDQSFGYSHKGSVSVPRFSRTAGRIGSLTSPMTTLRQRKQSSLSLTI